MGFLLKEMKTERVIKEIVAKYKLRDGATLGALIEALYSAVGSLSNTHRLALAAGARIGASVSDHTVRNYIGYLEEVGLFRAARRYDIKARKYFGSPLKYYAADAGALKARLGSGPQDAVRLQENSLFNELIARGFSVDIGVVELNRLDRSGRQVQTHHQISFIASAGQRKAYIQLAPDFENSSGRERALCPLLNSGDFFPRLVVLPGSQPLRTDDLGLHYIGIGPLLQNLDSLLGLM